jgi:hypothetical protein
MRQGLSDVFRPRAAERLHESPRTQEQTQQGKPDAAPPPWRLRIAHSTAAPPTDATVEVLPPV